MDISALNGVSPVYSNIYTQKSSFDDDNKKTDDVKNSILTPNDDSKEK